jgi:hypothetical protein
MKVYLGYKAYPFMGGWEVVKVFDSEYKAKKWMQAENAKVHQEFDDYGLVEGEEFNYFEKVVE